LSCVLCQHDCGVLFEEKTPLPLRLLSLGFV
jgi:hypothetical protein